MAAALVVGLGYMPGGRQAPPYVQPQGLAPEAALQQIRDNLGAMEQTLAHCEQRFGSRAKLAHHFILGPLNARQWRKFHWVHTRHHMRQIAALRAGSF